MCRYACKSYKEHFACFQCRKAFKRRLMADIKRGANDDSVPAKCPQCSALMANMGKDFEAPAQKAVKQWQHLQLLYTVGITFHSCGCSGPGYIPANQQALKAYFEEILAGYEQELLFWRNRTTPETSKEKKRDLSKNWEHLRHIPGSTYKDESNVSNETARQFWLGKIEEVRERMRVMEKG